MLTRRKPDLKTNLTRRKSDLKTDRKTKLKGTKSMARENPKPRTSTEVRPSHEEITRRAYQIYMERGCPEGHSLEHWLEAENQLIGAQQSAARTSTSRTQTQRRF